MLSHYTKLIADQADILFADVDQDFARTVAETALRATALLTSYFAPNIPVPRIRVILVPTRNEFDRLVADLLGVEIERPSDPRRVAQPQGTDIILLAPSAYSSESAYDFVPEDLQRMIHHELVHVFQELLSPGIEESPLWWDEGLAVYLSGQWQYESQFDFREPVLQAIRDKQTPPWSAIQANASLAYSFGWTIVRFIEQEMGKDFIVRVVHQMDDGDIFTLLERDVETLEAAWSVWLLHGAGSSL